MSEFVPLIGILIALLGTRRVFRLVIPKHAPYPTMGQYVLAWIFVWVWWAVVAYFVDLIL